MDAETGERLAHGRGQRLHPLSPVFEIGRHFFSIVVPGLVVLLLAAGDRYEVWYMFAFVPAAIVALKRYLTLRYALTPEHLVVREGVFFKKTRHIPYARIQNIETVQNPLHRLFGVAEVRLETASGQEPEAVLRVLSLARLEEIRAGVFHGRGRPAPAEFAADVPEDVAPPAQEEESVAPVAGPSIRPPFVRMSTADLVVFGLLSQKGLAYLFGLTYLVWEFDLGERLRTALSFDPERALELLTPLLALGVGTVLVVVLQALTVAWAFVTLYDFKIVRHDEDLRTTCGLWTRHSATLPRRRIQFLQVREGLFQRLFGRIQVKALTAGADASESNTVSRRWLVPLVRRGALASILREVWPDTSFEGVSWRGVHPRAVRRLVWRGVFVTGVPVALFSLHYGPWTLLAWLPLMGWVAIHARLRARRLGYALSSKAVLVRDGALMHVRNAVLFSRIQSVSVTQSPFDRRHGMARVRVDTAGRADTSLALSVPYLPLREARRLERRLRREAARSTFRW